MKKFSLSFKLLTLLLCSFLTVSCGDDDEEELPSLENQLEYDTTIYDLTIGATADLGPVGFASNDTHYGQVFLVTDATASKEKVTLVFYTFSLGTSNFKPGRFEYANLAGMTAAQQETAYGKKNIFLESAFVFDVNDDDELDYDNEAISITKGTLNISGTAPDYMLDCDVELENGKRVRAQYTGEFIDITDNIGDDDIKANMRKAPSVVSRAIPFMLRAPKF
ncbi:hypothetical protein [Rufibacter tibetensis]|uniref:Lipid/polyisoprenoid-binding YceI-like domain-containing protein n=1 Tax=Rufibacter tibetensis TaxID=512763 RepID=A0A0P0CRQ7_9BACT|nr:hypothetical protein [Rufibacter tibetensis]ALI99150.1 hypothetical protein DC20_09390 [Rufibacter tibetensis]